jgi:hypothetical protein
LSAPDPPADQPAQVEKLLATCDEVKGMVQYAPIGAKSTDRDAWKPVKKGGRYGEGIQIRTGIRSSVIFFFGDDTVVQIRRSTLAAIGEFHKTATTKKTRIGLDYGAVRAGVADTDRTGGLRSDFQIDSPTVTLSKRGTWDFELWVERGTGRYTARLADRGLVEVLNKLSGRRRQIARNQSVNQAMMNWVVTAKFQRQIVVADVLGQTADELASYLQNSTGRTGLQPAGEPFGRQATSGTPSVAGPSVGDTLRRQAALNALLGRRTRPPVHSGDGDFGTGSAFGSSKPSNQAAQRNMRAIFSGRRR